MSNDDGFAPPPADNSESGLGGLAGEPSTPTGAATPSDPGATGAAPLDPTQAMPSGGPADPPNPPLDPTQVMSSAPITPPSNPVQSGAGIPPIVPGVPPGAVIPPGGDVPFEEEFDDEPWYKNPRTVAAIVVGLLILGLIILLFFLLGGDDDGAIEDLSTDPVSLVILRTDSGGGPLSTSLNVSVTAQEGAADNYVWITPAGVVAGQAAVEETDATGRAEFRWGPAGEAADSGWTTRVEMVEAVFPEGDQPVSGIGAECQLERGDSTDDLVIAAQVQFGDGAATDPGVGTYNFPNVSFRPGDRVTCTLQNQVATPAPTTVAETTTVPETTTTVPETTAPPTTAAPTTAAPTTAAPTTAAPTTAAPTTAAPTGPSVSQFLTDNGYTGFRDLLIQVGVLGEIEASTQPFTLFAATNDAVTDFLNSFDPTSTDLGDVMRAHLSDVGALDRDDLSTRSDIAVDSGGPQPLNFGPNPPTIGGADITEFDNAVENASPGYIHIIEAMLTPEP
ncbi:fasciclin domain-containing protein [Ilumatobacter sp.]|uniref:fasciclin domain-containing protein n=1 Tax=Ilumatobacter sp. TaxID=1967498 RepID=UPI003C65FE8E